MTKNSNSKSKIAIIITAAGSSTRIGAGIKKEYLPFKNGTVLTDCAKTFLKACYNNYEITDFIITCPQNGKEDCLKILEQDKELPSVLNKIKIEVVEGSSTRQGSVYNGLSAIKNNPQIVLIHDGARPFVTEKVITEGIETALEYGASVPGITPTDTQKQIDEKGFIIAHLVRSSLTAVQTPQCFRYPEILNAHKKAVEDKIEYTDDTEIWGKYAGSVKVYTGDINNIKITYPKDLERLETK